MKLLLLGMNHRTAPLALREHYAVEALRPPLGKLLGCPEVEEAVLVSTCNRVEVMAVVPELEPGRMRLRSFFARDLAGTGPPPDGSSLDEALYEFQGLEAARHVFRVAASVDSMVIGEPQILGQVKDAFREAVACGACGSVLSRLYQRAFAGAKRVRNETRIAERPVSVARVAIELAAEIFDELSDKTALLVGAGEMVELALELLKRGGLERVRIANRTRARAAALAERFGASSHGLDELPALLEDSDVVLTSIGATRPVLDRAMFADALRARRQRPVFVIDIGVPRNVDPGVEALDAVFLYDIDDLGRVAARNAEEREREKQRAEAIVAEEIRHFDGWLAALSAVPTIRDLRGRADRIREAEVSRVLGKLDLEPAQREAVEGLARGIVNKLLHVPISRLRDQEDREQGLAALLTARQLFGLDDEDETGHGGGDGDGGDA